MKDAVSHRVIVGIPQTDLKFSARTNGRSISRELPVDAEAVEVGAPSRRGAGAVDNLHRLEPVDRKGECRTQARVALLVRIDDAGDSRLAAAEPGASDAYPDAIRERIV